jgi:hypothetical protein
MKVFCFKHTHTYIPVINGSTIGHSGGNAADNEYRNHFFAFPVTFIPGNIFF